MVTRSDYSPDEVEAAKSVLIELVHLLREYEKDMVIVGGWVPALILPDGLAEHAGSTDIDIALDHRHIDSSAYAQISELLERRGYRRDERADFIWLRTVSIAGRDPTDVELDTVSLTRRSTHWRTS